MIPMTYKDYAARIEYSEEDGCFVGRIAGITDIVTFHGESVSEMRNAFTQAVDDYLDACQKHGVRPKKPYSGKLMIRVRPEVHARAAMTAAAQGKSLGAWAAEIIDRETL